MGKVASSAIPSSLPTSPSHSPKNPQLEKLKCWPVSHPQVWLQALPASLQPVHCGLLFPYPVAMIGRPPCLILLFEVYRCGCLPDLKMVRNVWPGFLPRFSRCPARGRTIPQKQGIAPVPETCAAHGPVISIDYVGVVQMAREAIQTTSHARCGRFLVITRRSVMKDRSAAQSKPAAGIGVLQACRQSFCLTTVAPHSTAVPTSFILSTTEIPSVVLALDHANPMGQRPV